METRRLAAIMFTDMVGYTKRMAEDEASALRLLEEHNALMREQVERGGGRILKFIGDAVLAEFPSALSGVECALSAQRALKSRNAGKPEKERIVLRAGLHLGDVVFREGDAFGDGVNIASRIEPLAEPGGVCVSRMVYDAVRRQLQLRAVSLGPRDLKGVGEAVEIFRLLLDDEDAARQAPEDIVRPEDPRLRTVVAPFWSAEEEGQKEGKNMAALLLRALEKELEGEDVELIFEKSAEVRTEHEARALARSRKAGMVLWGEVVSLHGEVAIEPRLTSVRAGSQARDAVVSPLETTTSSAGQLALRRAKAQEAAHAALYLAALHQYRLGDKEKAVRLFRKYLAGPASAEKNAARVHAWSLLSFCLIFLRRSEEALRAVEEGTREFPENFALQARMGDLLLSMNRMDEGLAHIRRAIFLHPGEARLHASLGLGLLRAQRPEESLRECRQAAAMKPEDDFVQHCLSSALLEAGDDMAALRAAEEAARLGPEGLVNWPWLGLVRLAMAFSRQPGEGGVRRDEAVLRQSVEAFERACRLAPLDPYLHLMLCGAQRLLEGNAPLTYPKDTGPWPGSIARYYRGELEAGALLEEAGREPDEYARRACLAEAQFYVALRALAEDDHTAALRALSSCSFADTGEDRVGRALLRRLA